MSRLNKSAVSPSYKSGRYWAAPRANAELPMCERCVEIDKDLARYKRLRLQIMDSPAAEAADRLMAKLEEEKAALHPEK
jgi:hypothetical protein